MEEGGPWAEVFFWFRDDLELGWWLNNAGWKVRFEPEARARKGGRCRPWIGSIALAASAKFEVCIITNGWMTLVRYFKALDLAWYAAVLLAWDCASVLVSLLRRPSLARHLVKW